MLDARLIAGDTEVFDVVLEHARNPPACASLVDPLLELVQQRHAQFNDTLYQLEPDIKQAPGGLRDVAVCRQLRALRPVRPSMRQPRRAWLKPKTTCCGSGRYCTFRPGATSIPHHELQEGVAEMMGRPAASPGGGSKC